MTTAFSSAAKEIRTVLDRIIADWGSVPYTLKIEGNNRDVIDLAKQTDPFICADILNLTGGQFDLAKNPRSKQLGQVQLAVVDKKGQGTGRIEVVLDFIAPYFSAKDLATVRFHTAALTKHYEKAEWYYQPVVIPFWYIWE